MSAFCTCSLFWLRPLRLTLLRKVSLRRNSLPRYALGALRFMQAARAKGTP